MYVRANIIICNPRCSKKQKKQTAITVNDNTESLLLVTSFKNCSIFRLHFEKKTKFHAD